MALNTFGKLWWDAISARDKPGAPVERFITNSTG
ncbi:MAG: hypothetical protein ACJA1F_001393 [Paracoccaceae bacterium]|jgi:hypothetical protein